MSPSTKERITHTAEQLIDYLGDCEDNDFVTLVIRAVAYGDTELLEEAS